MELFPMTDGPNHAVIRDADIASSATIYDHVNLFGCEIGAGSKIDAFVYIEEDVVIGQDCTVRPFTFIPTGVVIGDGVFVGPNVTFTNDKYPSVSGEWTLEKTVIEDNVGIGAGATILPGVTIGEGAIIGAGSVVVNNVPPNTTVAGNPASSID